MIVRGNVDTRTLCVSGRYTLLGDDWYPLAIGDCRTDDPWPHSRSSLAAGSAEKSPPFFRNNWLNGEGILQLNLTPKIVRMRLLSQQIS